MKKKWLLNCPKVGSEAKQPKRKRSTYIKNQIEAEVKQKKKD